MSRISIFLFQIFCTLILSIHCDELAKLNEQFISTYNRARDHLISHLDPLIICNADNVVIIHRGKRFEEQVTPKLYHDLKSISHIPFKIYLTLLLDNEHLSDEIHNELEQYLRELHSQRKSLEFPAEILQTQYEIIDLSIEYLQEILKTKLIDRNRLKTFCQQAHNLFSKNIDLAAKLALNMLDFKIRPWYQTQFNQTERDRLKVVITGPQTARHGYLVKSYFYALLHESHEGNHIIFAENIDTEQKALEVLGVWLLDAQAGQSFFNGDGERLHRDLLSDAANLHIKHLFLKSKDDL